MIGLDQPTTPSHDRVRLELLNQVDYWQLQATVWSEIAGGLARDIHKAKRDAAQSRAVGVAAVALWLICSAWRLWS